LADADTPAGDSSRSAPDPRLEELIGALGVEEGTRTYVEELRWPDGVWCPRCKSDWTSWLEARRKHYCRGCHYQFRVTAGTVLHDSHVSLARWLIAIQLMLESDRGCPAYRLREVIGGSYKTAWFVGHRIRAALSRALLDLGMPPALAQAITEVEDAATPEPLLKAGGPATEEWTLEMKKFVAGAYHRPNREYLTAYWNESRWRAANIGNKNVFRETVCALVDTEPLPYRQLVDHTPLLDHDRLQARV